MYFKSILALSILFCAEIAIPETVETYVYDAKGRLNVACQATGGSGSRTTYTLDRADNRTAVASQNPWVVLNVGDRLYSADGRFFLVLQPAGNLVLYGPSGALWSTDTIGSGANLAVLQSYGNLVLYNGSGSAVWSNGVISHCSRIVVQNDGNVVIFSTSGAVVWTTNTGGH
jgi:hypothetical protein